LVPGFDVVYVEVSVVEGHDGLLEASVVQAVVGDVEVDPVQRRVQIIPIPIWHKSGFNR
jgi:hypothetical protein